jgi:Leucine-rich repeat (LRR) protein
MLTNNNFHGMIKNIEVIDLNSYRIQGEIPRSLTSCRVLEVLDIGNNKITDSFPSWFRNMCNLRVLIVRSNQFYGSIRSSTGSDENVKHFSGLQIIDLASNNFSGSLNPKWFDRLETMMANSSSEGYALASLCFVFSNEIHK